MLLLVGVMRGAESLPDPDPSLPPHLRVHAQAWTGLALEVAPEEPADEASRILAWAERQHQLLAQYAKVCDVLPVALGAGFSTQAALAAHLKQERARLAALFDRLEGCCEFVLKLEAEPTVGARVKNDETSGAAFLQQRRGARDLRRNLSEQRDAFRRGVVADAQGMSREIQLRQTAEAEALADLSLLVRRPDISRLVATLSERSDQSDALGVKMRLTGPMPVYSFIPPEAGHA